MNYENVAAPAGTKASVKVGDTTIQTGTPDFAKQLGDAITKHGYPASANPAEINYVMTVILLTILVIYVTLVYAPIAAWLVELFPTRIRYSGLSLPYHIGNGWFGGFLPATVFAIVAATGNIYSGLWYPIVVAAMSFVVGADLPARDQGARYYPHVSGCGGRARSPQSHLPRTDCAGLFFTPPQLTPDRRAYRRGSPFRQKPAQAESALFVTVRHSPDGSAAYSDRQQDQDSGDVP